MTSTPPTGPTRSGRIGPPQPLGGSPQPSGVSPRRPWWRAGVVRLAVVPMLVLLAGSVAACGGDTGDENVASAGRPSGAPSASSAPAGDDQERGRQFAACMRAEGIDVPDPGPDGAIIAGRAEEEVEARPGDTELAKQDAALEKCRQYLPDGGDTAKISQEDVEKIRKYAKCMRDNGAPDFPDPNPDGTITMTSSAMGTEAQLKKASEACAGQAPNMMPGIKVK